MSPENGAPQGGTRYCLVTATATSALALRPSSFHSISGEGLGHARTFINSFPLPWRASAFYDTSVSAFAVMVKP